ncbi:MAG: DUF1080 domain-containing protein [Kiritimatiellaeota bacterium]|nr:DUF1080 domain-containing protein [Kiritimatiellota bacterium]
MFPNQTMRNFQYVLLAVATLIAAPVFIQPLANTASAGAAPNTLTDQERQAGWRLLWDGKTTAGWRSAQAEAFPAQGWTIRDGVLTVHENKDQESAAGGDIITREKYSSFELQVDFKITPGANSGIKYFINPEKNKSVGYEYQILDDAKHPDARLGINGNRTLASLYDMLPARADKKVNPPGAWNQARILVNGNHVEHWLNGEKAVDYDRTAPEFRAHFEASKFKQDAGFCQRKDGHILLQDHGNTVSFRNLKIRELPEPAISSIRP